MEGHFVQTLIDSTGNELNKPSCLVKTKHLSYNGVKRLQLAHVDFPAPFNLLQQTMLYHTDGA